MGHWIEGTRDEIVRFKGVYYRPNDEISTVWKKNSTTVAHVMGFPLNAYVSDHFGKVACRLDAYWTYELARCPSSEYQDNNRTERDRCLEHAHDGIAPKES